MRYYCIQILFLLSILFYSCSEKSITPDNEFEDGFGEFKNGYIQRDYVYEDSILLNAGVDTNDFKSKYAIEEINFIISNSDESSRNYHQNIVVNYDIIYTNIYSLVFSSYDILEGIVLTNNPEWDTTHQFIETVTILDVSKSYKQQTELGEIIVRDIGGTIGEFETITAHNPLPNYTVGERVLVFVQKSENEEYRTYARQQGKFRFIIPDDN